jgi:hypothetical protein
MSTESKREKVLKQLEIAKDRMEFHRRKSMEDEQIEQTTRVMHCKRCHRALTDPTTRVTTKKGKTKHDCKAKGVAQCRNFNLCQYEAGHREELVAARRTAKLEEQAAKLDEELAQEVSLRFCVVLFFCCVLIWL